jgi:7,8-dihydroneopterin aldolase/epimerase/oxygenase
MQCLGREEVSLDKIYVNNMMFYGYHGVLPQETTLGQRFNVDLVVELDTERAGKTDDLTYSVSYADIYVTCKCIVEGKPYKLIEAVAENIAGAILMEYPLIDVCHVKVIKPDPPIPGHYHSVAVEITRSRR